MDIRRLNCALLGIAIVLTIIAVATNQWNGGNLLTNRNNDTAVAVGALLVVGICFLVIAFIICIVQIIQNSSSGALHMVFFVTLYAGVTSLLIAILVYTGIIAKQWSYLVAVMACVFALQVAILAAAFSKCSVRTSSTTTRRTVRVNH